MKFYTIFVLNDCEACDKAVSLMKSTSNKFIVININNHDLYIKNIQELSNKKDFPIILRHVNEKDNQVIGGLEELEEYLSLSEEQKVLEDSFRTFSPKSS